MLQDRLMAMPATCAPLVIGLHEVREVEMVMADEQRRALLLRDAGSGGNPNPDREPAMNAEPLQATPASVLVTYRPCAELAPYARNSRKHSPDQIAQIAVSIAAFGWTNPVLADAQGIVAGHSRVLGAERLYARGATLRLPNGEAIPARCVPVLD